MATSKNFVVKQGLTLADSTATGSVLTSTAGALSIASTSVTIPSANLLIGSTNPQGKITANGAISALDASNAYISQIYALAGVSVLSAYSASGQALAFYTTTAGSGATERMRIDSNGNVAVGTTVTSGGTGNLLVQSKFTIQGISNSPTGETSLFIPSGTNYAGFKIKTGPTTQSNGGADYYDITIRPGYSGVGANADQTMIRFENALSASPLPNLILQPAGTANVIIGGSSSVVSARVGIYAAGSPGIGITGNTVASGSAEIVLSRAGATESAAPGNGAGIQFQNATNGTTSAAMMQQFSSNIQFMNYSTGTWVERLRIDSIGNSIFGGIASMGASTYTFGHGGTQQFIRVHNPNTTLNGQSHVFLTGSQSTNASSAMGTVTWALPNTTNGSTTSMACIGATTGADHTSAAPTSYLLFATRASGGVNTEKMRLDQNGNLMLGAAQSAPMRVYVYGSSGGGQSIAIDNVSTAGYASFRLNNGNASEQAAGMALHNMGSGYPSGGAYMPSSTVLTNFSANGLVLNTEGTPSTTNNIRLMNSSNLMATFGNQGALIGPGAMVGYNFLSANAATTAWYLIATLPSSSTGTYDQMTVIANFNDNWNSGANRSVVIQFANRGGFTGRTLSYEGGAVTPAARLQAFTQTDGTTQIYVVMVANYYATCAIDVRVSQQVAKVLNPVAVTTQPAGTLAYDTYSVSPFITTASTGTAFFPFGVVNPAGSNYNENIRFPRSSDNYVSIAMACDTSGAGAIAGQFNMGVYPSSTNGGNWYNGPAGNAVLQIDTSGNVFIGAVSAATTANGDYFQFLGIGAGAYMNICHYTGTASGRAYHTFNYNGATIGGIGQSGTTAVVYNTTSDERLKTNIVDAQSASDAIDKMQVREYDFKTGDHVEYGFVAQELVDAAPQAVTVGGDDVNTNPWAVDYSKLVPMLVKEIQELRARVAVLEAK